MRTEINPALNVLVWLRARRRYPSIAFHLEMCHIYLIWWQMFALAIQRLTIAVKFVSFYGGKARFAKFRRRFFMRDENFGESKGKAARETA